MRRGSRRKRVEGGVKENAAGTPVIVPVSISHQSEVHGHYKKKFIQKQFHFFQLCVDFGHVN